MAKHYNRRPGPVIEITQTLVHLIFDPRAYRPARGASCEISTMGVDLLHHSLVGLFRQTSASP
jgi:hypothetical protein